VTLAESIEVCRQLDALGIDAIEVSGGIKETGFVTPSPTSEAFWSAASNSCLVCSKITASSDAS
jgi:isopropylmalate/homocitrate/citramalate synthase